MGTKKRLCKGGHTEFVQKSGYVRQSDRAEKAIILSARCPVGVESRMPAEIRACTDSVDSVAGVDRVL